MAAQVGIWSVGDSAPVRIERSRIDLEADLEDWIELQPSLLAEGLQVIGRQLHVEAGFIDLLCLDPQSRWVVVELKRSRLYRDALVQAIDYAACIGSATADSLQSSIAGGLENLADSEGVIESVKDQLAEEEGDRDLSIIIAGAGVDAGLERVVTYLGSYELPIRVVSFDVFEAPDGSRMLVREVLDEDMDPPPLRKSKNVEQIEKIAEREGLGEAFRLIIEAARNAGIHCRPYKHSVMLTPESNKGRFLMLLNPREGQGLRFHHGPDAISEFYPTVAAQDVEDVLGPGGEPYFLTNENWEELTGRIVKFISELPQAERLDQGRGPKADFSTVCAVAKLIQPGEWTTYGDLSIAVTGQSSSAMAIGNMARTRTDFPNPHRILNLRGQIPSGWRSYAGHGPEECRRRLEEEGVAFQENGAATVDNRLLVEELSSRMGQSTAE